MRRETTLNSFPKMIYVEPSEIRRGGNNISSRMRDEDVRYYQLEGTSVKIGILSETHGNLDRTRDAIRALEREDVEVVLHCGDIGSESVLSELQSAFIADKIRFYAVLGNVDYPDSVYDSWSETDCFEILGRYGKITILDKTIAIIHGDNARVLDEAILSGDYAYVFTGHTHVKDDRRIASTRVINPGAVHRASVSTIAVLDLENDSLEFIDC